MSKGFNPSVRRGELQRWRDFLLSCPPLCGDFSCYRVTDESITQIAKGGKISCNESRCRMWKLFLFSLQNFVLKLCLILFAKSSTYGHCDSVTLLYVERLSDHLTFPHTWRYFLLTVVDPLAIAFSKRGRAICGDISCCSVHRSMWKFFLLVCEG